MANITTDVAPEKKRLVLNILAIIGFLAAIILIAWLAVQVVRLLPSAFSSLASIADSLYNNRPSETNDTFVIKSDRDPVVSGEEVTISWDATETPGSYTFTYDCTEGITLEIRANDSNREIRCDTSYSLGTSTAARLYVRSTRSTEASVAYTVSFLGTNDSAARYTAEGVLVAVPATEEVAETPETPQTGGDTPVTVTIPSTPRPVPAPQWTYYSYLPQSDPGGHIDLSVRYLDVGTRTGGYYTPTTLLRSTADQAARFEVRNIGTRTSKDWSYTVQLGSDTFYRSGKQSPLKPNERAIITVSLPVSDRDTGLTTLRIEIDGEDDRADVNDRFASTVAILD